MPEIGFMDLAIDHAMSRNVLLIPQHPDDLQGKSDNEKLLAMDIQRKRDSPDLLEPYKNSSEKLGKWANVLFVHLRS